MNVAPTARRPCLSSLLVEKQRRAELVPGGRNRLAQA